MRILNLVNHGSGKKKTEVEESRSDKNGWKKIK
jgi:hypothetical protein